VELERSARAEALVRESEECYRVIFDANPIPIWVTDHETMRFLAYNSAAVEHYGYSPAELDQMGLTSFLPPGEVARPDLPGTYRLIKKNETIIDVQVAVHPIRFRGREARLVLATDVTERNRAQALLEHRAHHDMLTGLPNRLAFRSSLERAVEGVGRSVMPFGVLLIDLDRFKEINDTMGHAYGDQALQQVGPRLNEVLRNGDVLARLGGDEFGIYLPNVDADGASQAAARLLEAFREPFVLDGRAFDLGLSIGIAIHPDDGDEVETLMHRADLAMYVAKRSRGGAVLHADTHRPGEPLPLAGRVAENGRHEVVR
jgi:diguanylate cyclase (GGDEF)-like protein/PAS domain S-box-containing protein